MVASKVLDLILSDLNNSYNITSNTVEFPRTKAQVYVIELVNVLADAYYCAVGEPIPQIAQSGVTGNIKSASSILSWYEDTMDKSLYCSILTRYVGRDINYNPITARRGMDIWISRRNYLCHGHGLLVSIKDKLDVSDTSWACIEVVYIMMCSILNVDRIDSALFARQFVALLRRLEKR